MRGDRGDMGDWVSAAAAAVRLLTRVPVPFGNRWNERVGRRSIVFFPLAGGLVGLLLGLAYAAGAALLPPPAAAFVAVGVWVFATGALHLDGWMDVSDAIGSQRPRERKLEIMKDPRVGAMGVAAGVLLVLGKYAFLLSLLQHTFAGSLNLAAAAATVPVLARTFLPWAIVRWPYARGASGMGAALSSAGVRHAAAAAAVGAACIAALLIGLGSGDAAMLLPVALGGAIVAAALGAFAASRLSRQFGGLTGDGYGAIVEGLELALLFALVLLAGA